MTKAKQKPNQDTAIPDQKHESEIDGVPEPADEIEVVTAEEVPETLALTKRDTQGTEIDVAQGLNPYDMDPDQFKVMLDRRKSNRDSLLDWVRSSMRAGVDFGRIHHGKASSCHRGGPGGGCTPDNTPSHWSKPSLWKPGAEKICGYMGTLVTFPTLKAYEDQVLQGKTVSQIIMRCEIIDGHGQVVATGVGARAVSQDNGDLNKALKMAKKSSHIDATLNLGGLSEIFTQDLEDLPGAGVDNDGNILLDDDDHRAPMGRAPQDPGKFDRTAPVSWGKKHRDTPWSEVDDDWLDWVINKAEKVPPAVKQKAQMEVKARETKTESRDMGPQPPPDQDGDPGHHPMFDPPESTPVPDHQAIKRLEETLIKARGSFDQLPHLPGTPLWGIEFDKLLTSLYGHKSIPRLASEFHSQFESVMSDVGDCFRWCREQSRLTGGE